MNGRRAAGRVTALLAAIATIMAPAGAAAPSLTGTVEQALAQYSVARYRGSRDSSPMSVIIKPFVTEETFKRENIGSLAAEIVVRHLMGFNKLQVLAEGAAKGERGGGELQGAAAAAYAAKVMVTGDVARRDGFYDISVRLTDLVREREIALREVSVPAGDFHKMLNRHLKWKHRVWSFQPYLQAMYTERYLAEGFPPRYISGSYLGVNVSASVEPARLAIDETAEFTGGGRLTYRRRVMLDLAYTAHGHSTSEGQHIVTITNRLNPIYYTRLLMYVNASAASAALCGTARLYGDLHGFAGAGLERTTAAQTVSSMSKISFSGPGGGLTELRGYFLSPEGPLPDGGVVTGRATVPFIRTGFEWRPRRLGFNFLATYRLGEGRYRPLSIGLEQVYRQGGGEPQRISYETMEVTRYHLPRLSIGAAFTLSL